MPKQDAAQGIESAIVVVPPGSDSFETLSRLQMAIETAEPGSVIQLEPGTYDISAVVADSPLSDAYSPTAHGDAFWFNPHHLPDRGGGYGVVIRGKQGLTIRGSNAPDGTPTTTIGGNRDFTSPSDPEFSYNVLFTIAGDGSAPSTEVKLERIRFQDFTHAVQVLSRLPVISAPEFEPGTHRVAIADSVFVARAPAASLTASGRHTHLSITGNEFLSDVTRAPHLQAVGHPNDGHLTNFRVEGNRLEHGGIQLVDRHEGTIVRRNSIRFALRGVLITHGFFGILPTLESLESGGGLIEANYIESAPTGVAIWSGSGWTIRGNTIRGAERAVWTEWGPVAFPDANLLWLIPASNNAILENDLRGNSFGVFVGAYSRDNVFTDNLVAGSSRAGYVLSGSQTVNVAISPGGPRLLVTFGRASGNLIRGQDTDEASVFDLADCTPGHCSQLDDDRDGTVNEDWIDGVNNDGDSVTFDAGQVLFILDEDPADEPNRVKVRLKTQQSLSYVGALDVDTRLRLEAKSEKISGSGATR